MWPLLLDMTKEECIQNLRNLELEAYSSLVSALRAQGPLSHDKRRLLKETSIALNITSDRHKAEVRRAISDERLNTIAYHLAGQAETLEDWAQEGRRMVPLLPRIPPQTAYSVIADEVSEIASQSNRQLPLPSNTERKRPPPPQIPRPISPEIVKPQPFRVPEPPRDESKKRKISCSENSSLAQHLLGPKLSRIQQIYRQASKQPKLKHRDLNKSPTSETTPPDIYHHNYAHHQALQPSVPQSVQPPPQSIHQQQSQLIQPTSPSGPKINILQNISLQTPTEDTFMQEKPTEHVQQVFPPSSNENQAPKPPKTINIKPANSIAIKASSQSPGPSSEAQKTLKPIPPKKSLSKGQKLIVVSNAQTLSTNSILQKTLSVPMNKVTKLNLEKFKIVSNTTLPSTIQVTTVVNSPNAMSAKHKVVTLKTNPGKKVIPLSQLQMLNSKGGIKVLPLSGKILGKNVTVSTNPLYISKNPNLPVATLNKLQEINLTSSENEITKSEEAVENGKESAKKEAVKDAEDFEAKIDEFQITQINCNDTGERVDIKHEERNIGLSKCDNIEMECDEGLEEVEIEHESSEEKMVIESVVEHVDCTEHEIKDCNVAAIEEVHDFQEVFCDETKSEMYLLGSSKISDIINPN